MDEQIPKVVSPKDCAVLLAVPMSRAQFIEDVELCNSGRPEDRRGDFAMNHCNSATRDEIEDGWQIYSRYVCKFAELLKATVLGAGGNFYEAATILSVGNAFSSDCSVVVILAHWKNHTWTDRDFGVASISTLKDFLSQDRGPEAAEFSRFLTEQNLNLDGNTRLRALAHVLNEFMELPQNRLKQDDLRDYFDAGLGKSTVPGNVLELRDGYHSSAAISRLVPSSWNGIVELGVCQSLRLALAIKMGRQDRRILTNENPKVLSRIFSELSEQFIRLSHNAQPYIPLRKGIHRDFSGLI